MYRIEDKVSAVKEVQRLLRVNQTGAYDSTTRNAVIKLQSDNSLDVTGEVDYETFTLIVEDFHHNKRGIWDNPFLHSPEFPFTKGNQGENVRSINTALSIVLKNFSYENELPYGAFFGDATIYGIRFLREIFGMEGPDEMDTHLMNRILLERQAIEIKNKYGL